MRDILILTDYRGLYRQGINRNQGINLSKVEMILKNNGFEIKILDYDTLINKIGIHNIKNYIIFYTSSQNEVYRSYVDDIIYQLSENNLVLPRYEILKCHENKCIEEVVRKKYKLDNMKSYVFSTYLDVIKYKDKFNYPIIIKCSTGSGSISVYKANDENELIRRIKKISRGKGYFEFYLKFIYKKIKRIACEEYLLDEKYYRKYIIQEFISGLDEDWKVLIFSDKFYALNRKVRKGDFRASGSGMFSYLIPPESILNKAKEVYEKLDVPFLSLDLCIDKKQDVHLIEFQGVHFGPYTLMNSPYYFEYKNEKWNRIDENSDLSEEYGWALVNYIKRKKECQN